VIQDSRFKIQDSKFKIQSSVFQIQDSRFQIHELCPSRLVQEQDVPTAKLLPRQLQFLLRVAPPALESQRAYEIPACITIAQAILESATAFGWGSSSLFRLANNPFGIKYGHGPVVAPALRVAGGSKMRAVDHRTARLSGETLVRDYGYFDAPAWESENGHKKFATAHFRRFPNLHEAFRVHAELLRAARYRPAFDVRHDWKQFAERLGPKSSLLDSEHCGYSTNPSYFAELTTLVDSYQLDDSRAVQWYATGIADRYQVSAAG
jgi:flagellum-specific peptidoglycan hydrolase FlgJ